MNKFVLVVEFDVKPECLDEFNRLIDINAHASVANEAGCYQFDVVRGMEDPSKILLYEVYASEEAFKVHMGWAHTQTFLAAAKPLITRQAATRWLRSVLRRAGGSSRHSGGVGTENHVSRELHMTAHELRHDAPF